MSKTKEFIMKPKIDYCFKELMKNPKVRKGFIGALMEIDPESITKTELLPTIQEKKRSDDKFCILDVLVKMEDGTELDFEMQLDYYPDWDKRSIFYLSEMVVDQLRSGDDYDKLNKCIHVAILDFELFSDYNGFHTKFHLWDDEFRFKYSEVLEFHVLELKKLGKYLQEEGELLDWVKFFNSETREDFEIVAKRNRYIGEAYKDVLNLSESEIKRYEYRAREKALKDHVSFTNAARREGLRQGLEQGKAEIIESALRNGRTPEEVAEFNDVPLDYVLEVEKGMLEKA